MIKIIFLLLLLTQIFCSSEAEYIRPQKTQQVELGKKKFDLKKFHSKKENAKNLLILDPIFLPHKNLTGEAVGRDIFKPSYQFTPNLRKEHIDSPSGTNVFLIPYLVQNGFHVYLFTFSDTKEADIVQMSKEIPNVLEILRKEFGVEELSILGVSMGGQALAGFIQTNPELAGSSKIQKYAFLGTGFDYDYTNSLLERHKKASKTGKPILCNPEEKDNLCNKFITSIYLKRGLNQMYSYPVILPKPETETFRKFSVLGMGKKPTFIIYGQIDGISPEEAVVPPFYPEAMPEGANVSAWEASTANNISMDYDHFDLFLSERSHKEVYPVLVEWLQEK